MSYPVNRPLNRVFMSESTTSMASSPVSMSFMVPVSGYLREVNIATTGTTTGTITVAVAQNGGSDLASGGLTIAAGAGYVPSTFTFPLTGPNAVAVNAGDVITLSMSGGTGSSIGGAATVTLAK